MLRLFRHVRQRLFTENKFSKYLLYAVGEILLVVIGILIALQVNSWNENRLARRYQEQILREINSQLQSEKRRYLGYLGEIENARKSTIALLHMSKAPDTNHDSLLFHLQRFRMRIFLVNNKGAYESLKSSGLERISNDSLRSELSGFYENYVPGSEIMVNEVLGKQIERSQSLFNDLISHDLVVTPDQRIKSVYKGIESKTIKTDRFLEILRLEADIQDGMERTLNYYLLVSVNKITNMIESELDSFN